MKLLRSKDYPRDELIRRLQPRAAVDLAEPEQVVRAICQAVRDRGDEALLEYVARFDSPAITRPEQLQVTPVEFAEADRQVSDAFREAVAVAIANIERYHRKQLRPSWIDTRAGCCWGRSSAQSNAWASTSPPARRRSQHAADDRCAGQGGGGAVPGPLHPPAPNGTADPHILYAAKACGIERVYKVGGAQAVAAMAYGTATVPRVDKIAGPGNRYVILAKREVFGQVGSSRCPDPPKSPFWRMRAPTPATWRPTSFRRPSTPATTSRCW